MPDAEVCDSNRKYLHSDAGQSYLITYSLPLLSVFPDGLLQSKQNGAKLAILLCSI